MHKSVIVGNISTVNKGGTAPSAPTCIYQKVRGFSKKSIPCNPENEKQLSSFQRDERVSLLEIRNSLAHVSNITSHGIRFTKSKRDDQRNISPVLMSNVASGNAYKIADKSFRYVCSKK